MQAANNNLPKGLDQTAASAATAAPKSSPPFALGSGAGFSLTGIPASCHGISVILSTLAALCAGTQ